jgi:hypothetical protein
MKINFTEQQLADAFAEMPGGTSGFLKEWGYVTYARALERIVNHPTITIGSRKVNAPMRSAPPSGTTVWLACVTCVKGVDSFEWGAGPYDEWLQQGLLFHTQKDAIEARDAILEMLQP